MFPSSNRSPRTEAMMLRAAVVFAVSCAGTSAAYAGAPVLPFPGNDHSYAISASRDLRYVAFVSNASNLVAADTNGRADVFVADRQLGTLRRASVNVDGIQSDGSSVWPSISNDGRYVVFDTDASNIGVAAGLVRKDLQTGAIALVATGGTSFPSLSDDGAYAASDPGGHIRFHDIGAGTTTNVTVLPGLDDAHPVISGDGRYVFFASNPNNAGAGDGNNLADVYRWDRLNPGTLQRVSLGTGGVEPNGATPVFFVGARATNAMRPIAVSADGNLVAFNSVATNLTVDAGGARGGLFIRNITTGGITKLASCNVGGGSACTAPFGNIFNGLDMSSDGAHVTFSASASFFGGVPSTAQTAGYYIATVATGALTRLGDRGPGQADIAGQFATAVGNGGALAAIQTTNLYPAAADDRAQYADVVALTVPALAATLLSRASQGKPGDGHARQPALSDSGRRVAFASDAGNLVPGDTNAYRDIFLRDLATDTITRVNLGLGGVQTNGASAFPSISGDGQVIAFGSEADNIVAGDTPGTMDVFVRPAAGPIERVSVGVTGVSGYSGLSQDGRYVAFADNVNVYLYDRVTQVRTLASPTVDALPPNENCNVCEAYRLSLTDDGRYLVFSARSSNHVAGQNTGEGDPDIFMFDRVSQTLELVSRATGSPGTESGGTNLAPWISGDARYLAWHSSAINLGGPANISAGVYLRDRLLNTTVFVGNSPRPGTFRGMEGGPMVSRDGSHVTYLSTVGTIVPGDSNLLADVFLWKREDATTRRISLSAAWSQANGSSYSVDASAAGFPRYFGAALSADGAIAAFSAAATNLAAQDDNASDDIFVVDRDSQAISRVSAAPLPPSDEDRTAPAVSANGNKVVMVQTDRSGALSGTPVGKGGKGIGDKWASVVVVDFATKDEVQLDVSSTEAPADGDSYFPAIAPAGDVASFASDATNLGSALDTNGKTDVFLRDTASGTTVAITANADSDSGRSATTSFGDKWGTAFESNATNLPGATSANSVQDVFVATEGATQNAFTIEPVSIALGGGPANGPSGAPSITEDARFVAYSSLATNLVASDTNGVSDVYVRDLVADTTTRVSLGDAGVAPNGASGQVAIVETGPGAWVATFESEATNLKPGDTNAETDVFVRTSGSTTELISKGIGGVSANGKSLNPSISPDGQFVTFTSTASNLVAGDTNNLPDVFLYDRVAQSTRRISVGAQLQQADDYALRPAIGQTGAGDPVVVWDTAAENLVPGDSDDAIDVFRFDDGSGFLDSTNTVIFRNGFE